MKRFKLVLTAVWVFYFATVAILFAFPKPTLGLFGRYYFYLFPLLLMVFSALYGLACLYRAGIKRG